MNTDIRERSPTTVGVTGAGAAEHAWTLLADPRRWPEWAGGVRRVTVTKGNHARPPLVAAGQLLVVHGPTPGTWRLRVDAVDRPHGVTWTAALGPWRVHGRHDVEPDVQGCRVTAHGRLAGPAAPLLSPLVRRWTRRGLHELATRAARGPG